MIMLCESRYRVFGSPTFRGNPVTLCEVDALDDDAALLHAAQRSATEDNVFFTVPDGRRVSVRFFSSTAELWLCGHGLLALSYHLRARDGSGTRDVQSPSATWQIHADAQAPGVLMPVQHGVEIADSKHWMKQALFSIGIEHEHLYKCPNDVWVAVLRGMTELLRIDSNAVASFRCGGNRPGALIAAISLRDERYGFRYFAPWHGKQEDSGTGSAHCYLAPLFLDSRARVTALQFGPEGMAEMRIGLRNDVVELSGRVELCT